MSAGDGGRANGRRDVDRILVGLIASGATIRQAAEAVHVSPSTVRRRLDDPGFAAAVTAERARIVDTSRGRLIDATTTAVETLVDVATNGRTDSARVSAARAIIDATMSRPESIAPEEAREIVRRIMDAAFENMPDDAAQARFFGTVDTFLNPDATRVR